MRLLFFGKDIPASPPFLCESSARESTEFPRTFRISNKIKTYCLSINPELNLKAIVVFGRSINYKRVIKPHPLNTLFSIPSYAQLHLESIRFFFRPYLCFYCFLFAPFNTIHLKPESSFTCSFF
jgi:hypothetical protein